MICPDFWLRPCKLNHGEGTGANVILNLHIISRVEFSCREVWRDGMWIREEEELAIEKMEAQAWICLYNLLSTREVISPNLISPKFA